MIEKRQVGGANDGVDLGAGIKHEDRLDAFRR